MTELERLSVKNLTANNIILLSDSATTRWNLDPRLDVKYSNSSRTIKTNSNIVQSGIRSKDGTSESFSWEIRVIANSSSSIYIGACLLSRPLNVVPGYVNSDIVGTKFKISNKLVVFSCEVNAGFLTITKGSSVCKLPVPIGKLYPCVYTSGTGEHMNITIAQVNRLQMSFNHSGVCVIDSTSGTSKSSGILVNTGSRGLALNCPSSGIVADKVEFVLTTGVQQMNSIFGEFIYDQLNYNHGSLTFYSTSQNGKNITLVVYANGQEHTRSIRTSTLNPIMEIKFDLPSEPTLLSFNLYDDNGVDVPDFTACRLALF